LVLRAILTSTLGDIAAVGLTLMSVALLGYAAGRTLALVAGPLILVELLAFTRAPMRFGERRVTHVLGFSAVANWRVWAIQRVLRRPANPVTGADASTSTHVVIYDTDALQDLWLTCVVPVVSHLVALVVIVSSVGLALASTALFDTWTALWWVGATLACSFLMVGLSIWSAGQLWPRAERVLAADASVATALGSVVEQGPTLALADAVDLVTQPFIDATTRRSALKGALARRLHLLALSLGVCGVATLWLVRESWVTSHHLVGGVFGPGPVAAVAIVLVAQDIVALSGLETAWRSHRAVVAALRLPAVAARLQALGPDASLSATAAPDGADAHLALREVQVCGHALPSSTFDRPRHIAIVGPSGSGKSTTLRCVAGLDRPDAGQVLLGEVPLREIPEEQRASAVHWIPFESTWLDGYMRDVLTLGSTIDERVARELLELAGFSSDLDQVVGPLSRGEAARLAIVRALLHPAPVTCIDDPFSAIRSADDDTVLALLNRFTGSVIVTTHSADIRDWAAEVWDLSR
jgi:ABC-type transport system involved in cytochrome bd biosynthesis fused ATPase/permease subunit